MLCIDVYKLCSDKLIDHITLLDMSLFTSVSWFRSKLLAPLPSEFDRLIFGLGFYYLPPVSN